MRAAAPALQDLTITDVAAYFGVDDIAEIGRTLRAILLLEGVLTARALRLAAHAITSSPHVKGDAPAVCVILCRLALLEQFMAAADVKYAWLMSLDEHRPDSN